MKKCKIWRLFSISCDHLFIFPRLKCRKENLEGLLWIASLLFLHAWASLNICLSKMFCEDKVIGLIVFIFSKFAWGSSPHQQFPVKLGSKWSLFLVLHWPSISRPPSLFCVALLWAVLACHMSLRDIFPVEADTRTARDHVWLPALFQNCPPLCPFFKRLCSVLEGWRTKLRSEG